MAEVWIPPQMQSVTGGQERVQVAGNTVRQLVNNLEEQFPGIKAILYDEEEDDIMPGLAVIVDGEASQLGGVSKLRPYPTPSTLPSGFA